MNRSKRFAVLRWLVGAIVPSPADVGSICWPGALTVPAADFEGDRDARVCPPSASTSVREAAGQRDGVADMASRQSVRPAGCPAGPARRPRRARAVALLPRLPGRHRPRRGRDLVHHRERAARHPDPVEEPRRDRRGRPRALRRELARGPAGRRRGARHLGDRAREAQGRGRRRGRARQAPEPGDGAPTATRASGSSMPGAARRALERRPRPRAAIAEAAAVVARSQGPHRPDRRGGPAEES